MTSGSVVRHAKDCAMEPGVNGQWKNSGHNSSSEAFSSGELTMPRTSSLTTTTDICMSPCNIISEHKMTSVVSITRE